MYRRSSAADPSHAESMPHTPLQSSQSTRSSSTPGPQKQRKLAILLHLLWYLLRSSTASREGLAVLWLTRNGLGMTTTWHRRLEGIMLNCREPKGKGATLRSGPRPMPHSRTCARAGPNSCRTNHAVQTGQSEVAHQAMNDASAHRSIPAARHDARDSLIVDNEHGHDFGLLTNSTDVHNMPQQLSYASSYDVCALSLH